MSLNPRFKSLGASLYCLTQARAENEKAGSDDFTFLDEAAMSLRGTQPLENIGS
jgi:hypothetical protein